VAFFVYILASKRNGTLYVGMTDNLARRIWQHRNGTFSGFTQRYDVKTLVWFEIHNSRESAFARERRLKTWERAWKLALIERENPHWRDLWPEISSP
jgi:putative endonuclease